MPKTGNDATHEIKAKKILEINPTHKIYEKIKKLYADNQDGLKEFAEVLLDEAKLLEGLEVEDMGKFVSLSTKYMAE